MSRLVVAESPFELGRWSWRLVGRDGQTLQRSSNPHADPQCAMIAADDAMAERRSVLLGGLPRRASGPDSRWAQASAGQGALSWWERPL